jgi:flagellin
MAVINTNIASLNAQRNLLKSQNDMQTAMQRLSSGLRINSAKDDAAGLAISDRMTAQINGLNQATRNANDATSIAQVAEGALGEITNALQRIRVLAVQSANDTNTATDRASLQKEVSQLQQEITRLAQQTQFNGKALLDGSFQNQVFQVGAYANQSISFGIDSVKAADMGAQSVAGRANIGAPVTAPSMTVSNGVAAGTLKISSAQTPAGGVAIDVTAGESAKDIAAAVNAVAGQTGVNATASTSLTLALSGSNAIIVSGDKAASFTLQGQSISVTGANGGDLTATDLANAINNANIGVTATLDDPTNPTKITLTAADGSDIQIANFKSGAGLNSATTKVLSVQDGTLSAVADATTSVEIGDGNTITLSNFIPTGAKAVSFKLGSTTIEVPGENGNDVTADNIATYFNKNPITGVTVSANSGNLTIQNGTGSGITLSDLKFATSQDGLATAPTFGLTGTGNADEYTLAAGSTAVAVGGQVSFVSANTFSVTDSGTGVLSSSLTTENSDFTSGSEYSVDKIDITTQAGANRAISIVDAALAYVDDQRANLGAIQNRFSSVVSSNSVTSENVAAARSRVLDADFAAETANLSRAQILQQAGTAMLAQANASTQNVLTLLR